jgi:hypothetical protein
MLPDDERLYSVMGLGEPMEGFIHRYIDSFVKWEIVHHFHEHPDQRLKPEELARDLNRPPEQVRRELLELTESGLVTKRKSGKNTTFAYSLAISDPRQKELHDRVNQFHALCQTRDGRLRVIYLILKNGKPLTE